MMGATSSSMWSTTYLSIKNKHDIAFQVIEQAICLEEQEKKLEAIAKYSEGIRLIDEALRIPVECPEEPDETWSRACKMIQKIKRTRAEVLTRITCVQASIQHSNDTTDQPPSYEEAVGGIETQSRMITYKDLAAALQELNVDPNQNLHEELVYSHPGVRLYFISPTGEVLSTKEPQLLKISLVEGGPNTPNAILQIGDWIYPLVPGVSPCFRTDYQAFILPDVYSEVPGSSVGIILPTDADAEVFELLESILHGIVTQDNQQDFNQDKQPRPPEDSGERISRKIVNGAWMVSLGIIRGAEKAGGLINRGTPKLIDNINPAELPTEVSASVTKGVKIAETATSKAVQVTGYLAGKVGEGTSRLGQFLSPHIQRQGTKLLVNGFHYSEQEASTKMKNALTIAAGAVEGFSTVYRGLETSAGILGNSLKDNTVKVVDHRWGANCAAATESSLSSVGNAYGIYQNTKILRPKEMLKNTARGAGTSFARVHSTQNQPGPSNSQEFNRQKSIEKEKFDMDNEKKPKD